MMQKPFSIRLFAICFLLVPPVNILMTGWFNHWPLTGPRGVLEHYSDVEKLILILYPIVAVGIWSVRRWGFYLFVVFSSVLVLRNFYILWSHQYYSRYIVLLFQVTMLSLTGFFLQENVFAPYFDPKMRWWESWTRYKLSILGTLLLNNKKHKAEILDISRGGCFLKTDSKLKLDSKVRILFMYKDREFESGGVVTWISNRVEGGYGVGFRKVSFFQRLHLWYILAKLRQGKKVSKKITKA